MERMPVQSRSGAVIARGLLLAFCSSNRRPHSPRSNPLQIIMPARLRAEAFPRDAVMMDVTDGPHAEEVHGATILPGAPFAPSWVWQELQSPVDCGVTISRVYPVDDVICTVYG